MTSIYRIPIVRIGAFTINHIYNIVIDTMKELENINLLDITKRKQNQAQLNRAYKILDDLKGELIRENIKRRHTNE